MHEYYFLVGVITKTLAGGLRAAFFAILTGKFEVFLILITAFEKPFLLLSKTNINVILFLKN
jgi:hypothetical protein